LFSVPSDPSAFTIRIAESLLCPNVTDAHVAYAPSGSFALSGLVQSTVPIVASFTAVWGDSGPWNSPPALGLADALTEEEGEADPDGDSDALGDGDPDGDKRCKDKKKQRCKMLEMR
jgi:hypothetical protein